MDGFERIKHRKTLDNLKEYVPGKSIKQVQKETGMKSVVKLASNEHPFGPSQKVLDAIAEGLVSLNRYPDAAALDLKEAIASELSLAAGQLIITNGTDELITLLSETFLEPGDEVIVPAPSFSAYEFEARLMGAEVVPVPLDADYEYDVPAILAAVTDRTKLVYVCSPNNPTGTYLRKPLLEKLLTGIPDHVLVVMDSAYAHFATRQDYTDGLECVQSGFPIVVAQTFSKVYGLAGLRIGFGAASENIIQKILRVKEPFNVNSIAQIAAATAIGDYAQLKMAKEMNTAGREQLYQLFEELSLPYTESMGNFVLVQFGPKAETICQQLLSKGVIVRPGAAWGLPEHLRISVGSEEENAILRETICSLL